MVVSFLFLLAVADAPAATPAPPGQSAPDKVVCRLEQEAHSRIPQRICRTESQWAEIAREAEESLKRAGGRSDIKRECQVGVC